MNFTADMKASSFSYAVLTGVCVALSIIFYWRFSIGGPDEFYPIAWFFFGIAGGLLTAFVTEEYLVL